MVSRQVTESSIIAVQIFDQKKFKKKDQGFLGVINIRAGDVLEIALGGEGAWAGYCQLGAISSRMYAELRGAINSYHCRIGPLLEIHSKDLVIFSAQIL